MLLMVKKRIRGTIGHSIYRYAKANNKCMKDYDKNKESSYLQYWVKLPFNHFEWIKDFSIQ